MFTEIEVVKPIIVNSEVLNSPLTEEERLEFNARTARILDTFQQIARNSLDLWADLKYVKDHRLYREKYDTFADYCREELARDNSQIYRLIKDAELKEELLLAADNDEERLSIMSLKEGNTRFIRSLPEDVQLAFWKIAHGVGTTVLPHKSDNSIEVTTSYLETVAEQIEEITEKGGIHLDGNFIAFNGAQAAAEAAGTDEGTVKTALMAMGVTEAYWEAIQRQRQHIKEKSLKVDHVTIKGMIEARLDKNGTEYPVLIDSKDNITDLADLILSFNNRFVNISLKSPIKEI